MKVGVPYSYDLYHEGYNSTPSRGPEIFLAAPTKKGQGAAVWRKKSRQHIS